STHGRSCGPREPSAQIVVHARRIRQKLSPSTATLSSMRQSRSASTPALACSLLCRGLRETLLMANRSSSRFRAHALRLITGSAAVALLVVAGCGQLAEKERELTFRVVPGTASWFDGLPPGVEETDLAIDVNGKPQHIHAWWWPAAVQHAPAILYLHGSRWNLT